MASSSSSRKLHDKSSLRRRSEQLLIRALTVFFAAVARILPLRCLRAVGNAAGWLVYRLIRRRRRLGLENLRAALGDRCDEREMRRLLLRSAQNMAKTMLELLKMPSMSEEQFRRFAPIANGDRLVEAIEQGRGVIVITAHFGNWEALAASIASLGYDLTVFARDADDSTTAAVVNRSREAMGVRVLGRNTVRDMLRLLREGEVLGLLPDQHAVEGANLWLPFMGRIASSHSGPAMIAARTGALLVPCFARRKADDSLEISFLPAFSVPDTGDREQDIRIATERLNEILGDQILQYPDQWIWMHRRWRTPPDEEASASDVGGSAEG